MQPIRSRILKSLLLLFLFPFLSHAQSSHVSPISSPQNQLWPLWIDLSGNWQLTFEDRPDFAQPAYDDHAWQSQTLPGELPGIRSGLRLHGWLRRHVTLTPGTNCSHLALTVGVITQSRYEVWINGQRLPSSEKHRWERPPHPASKHPFDSAPRWSLPT